MDSEASVTEVAPGAIDGLDNRCIRLTILPTEKCNFRCAYCYEDFAIGTMPHAVRKSIKRYLDSRFEELDWIYLSWFGGEPLLAVNVILEISRYVERRKNANAKHCGHVTTNGYLLTAKMFAELCELGVSKYQISLDGYGDGHDKTRIGLGNDRGTFDRIWGNLVAIRRCDIECSIQLRVHHHPGNRKSVEKLLGCLRDEFLSDNRFYVRLQAIKELGGVRHGLGYQDQYDAEVAEEELRTILNVPVGNGICLGDPRYVCYAARPNSYVIRADGRVAKCTVALNDEKNMVGRLSEDGRLLIDAQRHRPWIGSLLSGNDSVNRCPLPHVPAVANVATVSAEAISSGLKPVDLKKVGGE